MCRGDKIIIIAAEAPMTVPSKKKCLLHFTHEISCFAFFLTLHCGVVKLKNACSMISFLHFCLQQLQRNSYFSNKAVLYSFKVSGFRWVMLDKQWVCYLAKRSNQLRNTWSGQNRRRFTMGGGMSEHNGSEILMKRHADWWSLDHKNWINLH